MSRPTAILVALLSSSLASLLSCSPAPPAPGLAQQVSALDAGERRARAELIRDSAAAAGLSNGVLLGGIAQNETGLAHCWSEAMWACQGPGSSSCGGGPVIAGAGDGPCEDRQGGLGLFQFDAGTYDQTLAREGERVLTVEGNTQAAVDFVVAMVIRSEFIDGVETREQALAWMNAVRVDDANYPIWIRTVTSYYNGCFEGRCSIYATRYGNYDNATRTVLEEFGPAFWYEGVVVPTCDPLPPGGGIIEESGPCFEGGGNPMYLRRAQAGHGGTLIWTHATDSAEAANFGRWSVNVSESGQYRLEAYTSADYAQSRMTRYAITHAGGSSEVVLDQTAADDFQSLGDYRFEAGAGYEVFAGDNTGEPGSTDTQIVFDAVQLVRLDPTVPPADGGVSDAGPTRDTGPVLPPPDLGGPLPDVLAPGTDASPDVPVPGGNGGGCSVAGAHDAGAAGVAALWLLALLTLVSRRRR